MRTLIIRACELKRGDVFKLDGVVFRVAKITDETISFYYASSYNKMGGAMRYMGAKSKQRIELLTN